MKRELRIVAWLVVAMVILVVVAQARCSTCIFGDSLVVVIVQGCGDSEFIIAVTRPVSGTPMQLCVGTGGQEPCHDAIPFPIPEELK